MPKLFQPKPSYRYGAGTGLPEKDPRSGQDAPTGVIFDYYLPEVTEKDTVTLSIYDKAGKLVRTYTNQKNPDFTPYPGGPAPATPLNASKGINRFLWDIRREQLGPDIKGQFLTVPYRGAMLPPGDYKAVLTAKGQRSEVTAKLLANPLIQGVTDADWNEQNTMLDKLTADVADVHGSINSMRKAKAQLVQQAENYKGVKDADTLVNEANRIIQSIDEWESRVLQTRTKGGQDMINYTSKLNSEFLSLYGYLDTPDPRVTAGAKERLADIEREWATEKAKLGPIKGSIAKYNALVKARQVDAVQY